MRGVISLSKAAAVAVGCALACASIARADQSCDGVRFSDTTQSLGATLVLNGVGLRTATFLNVHVYVAALYLQSPTQKERDVLSLARSKQISLHFVRDVSRDEMLEAIHDGLQDNVSTQEMLAAEAHLKNFQRVLPELRKGTVLHLAYRPKRGLYVYQGKKLLGVENDDEFANLLFRVWLGRHPPDEDLKAGLLGGAKCD